MSSINLRTGERKGELPKREPPKTGTTRTPKPPSPEELLRLRIIGAIDKLAEWRSAREDEELAEVLESDKTMMARGLVSLVTHLPALKKPLQVFLALLEPILAFGAIATILLGRFADRRAHAVAEREDTVPTPNTPYSVPNV